MYLRNRLLIIIFALITIALLISSNTVQSSKLDDKRFLSRRQKSIRKAAEIADIAMESAHQILKRCFTEEITEADVAKAIAESLVENGSDPDNIAFPTIVASGIDSTIPHGDFKNDEYNVIKPGDSVVIDMGARYNGYVSDLTRTFFIGEPNDLQKKVYNIVLESQRDTIEAVRSFVFYPKLEKISREIITENGYNDFYPHAVSHGFGFRVHGFPKNSWVSYILLTPGMAITIEPGIYLPDEGFGVRIEDDVIVTLSGCDVITHYPKELEDVIIHSAPPEKINVIIEPSNTINLDSNGYAKYNIIIQNPSNLKINVTVNPSKVPDEWNIDISSPLLLEPNSQINEDLIIKAPQDFEGVKTMDLSFSYFVEGDRFTEGTPLTTTVIVKSYKKEKEDLQFIFITLILIVILIIATIILLSKRKK